MEVLKAGPCLVAGIVCHLRCATVLETYFSLIAVASSRKIEMMDQNKNGLFSSVTVTVDQLPPQPENIGNAQLRWCLFLKVL